MTVRERITKGEFEHNERLHPNATLDERGAFLKRREAIMNKFRQVLAAEFGWVYGCDLEQAIWEKANDGYFADLGSVLGYYRGYSEIAKLARQDLV